MLEFKGITFENYYPDDAEALFCGASFENYYPDEAEAWFYGASFEEQLVLNSLDVLFFAQL